LIALPFAAPPVSGFGATVWFTGLSGTSDVARELSRLLDRDVRLLGDDDRAFLGEGPQDTGLRRLGWVAATLAEHGVLVLTHISSFCPDELRQVRKLHEQRDVDFLEVPLTGSESVQDLLGLLRERGLA